MGQRRDDFVAEGLVELGPRKDFFVFVDGEMFGQLLARYSEADPKAGEYTPLDRAHHRGVAGGGISEPAALFF